MPVAISFTVETDGRLPSGQPLGEAIEQVDAETDDAPAYYMINCAHPTHFDGVLEAAAPWQERIRGSARERVHHEPRGARRGDRAGRRRSRPTSAARYAALRRGSRS